jgi:hypothetical protein
VSNNAYPGWHHIVVTRTGETGILYIDGQKADDLSIEPDDLGTDEPWFIGQAGNGEGFFNGYMDEVRIYDRALTATDVTELYNATIPEPGTLAVLTVGGLFALARKRRKA